MYTFSQMMNGDGSLGRAVLYSFVGTLAGQLAGAVVLFLFALPQVQELAAFGSLVSAGAALSGTVIGAIWGYRAKPQKRAKPEWTVAPMLRSDDRGTAAGLQLDLSRWLW